MSIVAHSSRSRVTSALRGVVPHQPATRPIIGSRGVHTQQFSVFRYNPAASQGPRFDEFEVEKPGPMVLDALLKIKDEMDSTLAFRRSCREGICGSCAMNINGENRLACTTHVDPDCEETVIRPLPHMFVLRDLVPDLTRFYQSYEAVQPWLRQTEATEKKEEMNLQSPEQRKKLDGLMECILCACCSTACPSQWWNPETFLGPQALLAAARWIEDSRDEMTEERLAFLNDTMRLYRCHNIGNCSNSCPKDLKPSEAIENIKKLIEARSDRTAEQWNELRTSGN